VEQVADTFMAEVVAQGFVRYLQRARDLVMKRPPFGGHSQIASRTPVGKRGAGPGDDADMPFEL